MRERFRITEFDSGPERDVQEEVKAHLELQVESLMAAGMSEEAARVEAESRFGDRARFEADARRAARAAERRLRRQARVGAWTQDLRYGLRRLRRSPGFSAAAVLVLALGIGGTTTVFSVVNTVLLKPLPYPDAEELVAVFTVWAGREGKDQMAPPDMADVDRLSNSLESLVGYQVTSATLSGMGDAELIPATRVSAGLLETFKVLPLMGRDIRSDEAGFGGRAVAVVSQRFWQDRLGSDPEAVGRTIRLSGASVEIIGVAPAGFDFPVGTEVWIPHIFNSPDSCGRTCHTWWAVGRLADGRDLDSAREEVRSVGAILAADFPDSNSNKGFVLEILRSQGTDAVQARLWLILAGASLLLLIACTNVANLLLMRTYTRRGEVALRYALGGSRSRVVSLVLAETGLLALAGGLLAIVLSMAGTEVIRRTMGGILPRASEIAVEGPVLLFCLAVIVCATALAALSPILLLSRVSPAGNLARQSRGRFSQPIGHPVRNGLIAAQIALSVVLLAGTGLLLRSLGELYRVDLGFNAEGLVRFEIARGGSLEEVRSFFRALEERVESIPGVEAVESVFGAPLGSLHVTARLRVEDRGDPRPEEETLAGIRATSPGYLEMMEIPLLTGRSLLASDDVGEVPVAVVNQTFVKVNFPGEDPIGKRVQVMTDQGYGSPVWTIVGTVGDIRSESLVQDPIPEIYVPHGQFGPSIMTVNVRSAQDPALLVSAIREEVKAMSPNLPLRNVTTTESVVEAQFAPTRFLMILGGVFAGIALGLSMVGLYGLLAFLTTQRRPEIGLRMALGAQRPQVLGMVLKEGATVTAVGLVSGLLMFFWAGRGMRALLFIVTPSDPNALLITVGVLVPLALVATFIPAWKASRIDPLLSLRSE